MEEKSCKQCWIMFTITDSDKDFLEQVSPAFAWKKYAISSPTFCPDCRQQRRLSFRNERKLYKRTCDFSWESIVSVYSPEKPYKIFHPKYRWSDTRDPMDYGVEVDMKKSFLEQYLTMYNVIPHLSLFAGVESNENSEYTNHITNLKNCYLIFNSYFGENSYYGNELLHCKHAVDFYNVSYSEYLYACVNCSNCYKVFFAVNCTNCRDSYMLSECAWLDHCIDCHNLQDKSYQYQNKPISKEEYQTILEKLQKEKALEIPQSQWFHKSNTIVGSEDCSGNDIFSCKNCQDCYDIKNSQDCKYCYNIFDIKDCMDIYTWWKDSSLMYDATCVGNNNHHILRCSAGVSKSQDMIYCSECQSCKECFGCIGLRNKQYCILNKQYSKADYEKLVPQIIEYIIRTWERWEFFPSSLSPFGYNETVAQEYFPLTKEEALAKWFNRSDYEAPFPKGDGKDVIICEVSGKPFRLIPQEIEFYKKHNLPFPTKHPDVRHAERMKLRNPRKLRDRKCAKCLVAIETTYAPERPEIVYCENCYNKEIYW